MCNVHYTWMVGCAFVLTSHLFVTSRKLKFCRVQLPFRQRFVVPGYGPSRQTFNFLPLQFTKMIAYLATLQRQFSWEMDLYKQHNFEQKLMKMGRKMEKWVTFRQRTVRQPTDFYLISLYLCSGQDKVTAEALYIQNEVRFASKYVVFQSFFHRILNDLT